MMKPQLMLLSASRYYEAEFENLRMKQQIEV